ncbi:MAG: NAD(P)/FAD-dependent oxidoreductase [Candidatus Omnitrophota bacterium]|nr:NAD(P)/FAD-dependent oxidoreductase [Candidatus Omnitrophota bacterium]
MEKIDITIIGGGVIGLAVAASIAGDDRDIYIFEKNGSFGQESSSRNSEVIHSGIYYPRDSLKKRTCIEGNRSLYDLCRAEGIPYSKLGKLIVARDDSEISPLEELFQNGLANGLEGLSMLTKEEVAEFEPNIKGVRAIYLPMTGIIDSHSLMEYFLARAKAGGADIIYDAEVRGIEKLGDGYRVSVISESGENYEFFSRIIINCAGLNSDEISKMAGIDNDEYTLSYCKGEYFRVGNRKNLLVKMLVYPVSGPDDSSLGIHVTPDLSGGMRLGPDAEYLGSREVDYSLDPGKLDFFFESMKGFLPFLEREDLSVDTSGIRAKLQGPGEGFRDFVIRHENEAGFEGFINLMGIESPGLTASPAIARMVKEIVDGIIFTWKW